MTYNTFAVAVRVAVRGQQAATIERLRGEVAEGRWGVAKASSERLVEAIRRGASAAALDAELL